MANKDMHGLVRAAANADWSASVRAGLGQAVARRLIIRFTVKRMILAGCCPNLRSGAEKPTCWIIGRVIV